MYSLEHFYCQNRESINANYPGINLRILNEWFSEYCQQHNTFEKREEFLSQIDNGVPLAQILGRAPFYRSEFLVTKDVLIPRPETEILVEYAVREIKKYPKDSIKMVDIGVGSGNIFLSILQDATKTLDITAIDISDKALAVAGQNAFKLAYSFSNEHDVKYLLSDRLEKLNEQVDIIVTNPPYIMEKADRNEVHSQVDSFEPELALFLEDESYFDWFLGLFANAEKRLFAGGVLLMEGHENHLQKLAKILEERGWREVVVIKDYTQRDRFIRGVWLG